MKRNIIITAVICLAVLLTVSFVSRFWTRTGKEATLKIGFVYDSDQSTPYTNNFMLAQAEMEEELGSQVQTMTSSNVHDVDLEDTLRNMVRQGCGMIFTNVESNLVGGIAAEYPEVQFCQASLSGMKQTAEPENYHTFNGEIYQARYVSGVVAGMKMRELLDSGVITAKEALVGFVGAFDNSEAISGFTAFLLGIHSVAPEATMRVKYIHAWDSYSLEKKAAQELINEGCVILSQYVDTVGVASACQEATVRGKQVYHVGYHQSMIDIAPAASLTSVRVNYAPYMIGAVQAVMNHRNIEKSVAGNVHGTNDISAGFDRGWTEVLELNTTITAAGTREKIDRTVENLQKGRIQVFQGNYIGVNPADPTDTIDLTGGYRENEDTSYPTFHYILRDYITIE